MVGGVVVMVKEAGILTSMLFVASRAGLEARMLFPFGSSSCSLGGSSADSAEASLICVVCVSRWESSFMATAVGGIVGGVLGGELFVMVRLSARRSISRPARYLGWGSVGITGGFRPAPRRSSHRNCIGEF